MSIKILNEPLLAQTLNDLIINSDNLTAASLARKLGIPTNKITRILNGDVTDPKASTLLQIANCFGITIDQLLGIEPMVSRRESTELKPFQILPVFRMNCFTEQQQPIEWYRWFDNKIEGDYIALTVDTDLYEPTFPKDSLLIIDLDSIPVDRSFIIIKEINSSRHIIKKYVIDGNKAYLYPINPKLQVDLYADNLYTIVGVILEIHQKLKNKN